VLLIAGLLGCFKPWDQLATLDFTDIPYDSPLVASDDARIRTYQTNLPCPDGSGARFYAVYRADNLDPAPLAVAFHSGAFDYEISPEATSDSALYGATWRTESRMSRDWADRMVWESLGMYPGTVIESEDNQGALPAAMVDAGINQIWPGNCWADLWHNEEGFQDNDYSREGFSRNGRTFAWWMLRLAYEDGFADTQGVSLPFAISDELYLAGLGDGGRGVVELLTHDGMPNVAGALLDSTPDTLSPYLEPTAELSGEADGLARLWADPADLAAIDDWSLLALLQANGTSASLAAPPTTQTGDTGTGGDLGGLGDLARFALPARMAMVWSAADPRQPLATTSATADLLTTRSDAWVLDTRTRAHVFTNSKLTAATALVDYLLTGQQTTIDWQATDSGSSTGSTTTTTGSASGTTAR